MFKDIYSCAKLSSQYLIRLYLTASIFALYAVVESAISLFSGSLYTNVYSATLEMFAGFPFFISAFCYLLGAVLIRYGLE